MENKQSINKICFKQVMQHIYIDKINDKINDDILINNLKLVLINGRHLIQNPPLI